MIDVVEFAIAPEIKKAHKLHQLQVNDAHKQFVQWNNMAQKHADGLQRDAAEIRKKSEQLTQVCGCPWDILEWVSGVE